MLYFLAKDRSQIEHLKSFEDVLDVAEFNDTFRGFDILAFFAFGSITTGETTGEAGGGGDVPRVVDNGHGGISMLERVCS